MKMIKPVLNYEGWSRLKVVLIVTIIIVLAAFIISPGKKALDYRVIEVSGGFGYEILRNGKVIIHQDVIPSKPGNQAFLVKQNAKKAALKVIDKIKAGKLPTLSVLETNEIVN